MSQGSRSNCSSMHAAAPHAGQPSGPSRRGTPPLPGPPHPKLTRPHTAGSPAAPAAAHLLHELLMEVDQRAAQRVLAGAGAAAARVAPQADKLAAQARPAPQRACSTRCQFPASLVMRQAWMFMLGSTTKCAGGSSGRSMSYDEWLDGLAMLTLAAAEISQRPWSAWQGHQATQQQHASPPHKPRKTARRRASRALCSVEPPAGACCRSPAAAGAGGVGRPPDSCAASVSVSRVL